MLSLETPRPRVVAPRPAVPVPTLRCDGDLVYGDPNSQIVYSRTAVACYKQVSCASFFLAAGLQYDQLSVSL